MSTRQHLRETTGEDHRALDAVVGSLEPFSSADGYARYLAGMRRLYLLAGNSVDACAVVAGLTPRKSRLVELLESDLASCGGTIPDEAPSVDRTDSWSDAARWGAAYVLEGSAMGARGLVRAAEQKLPAPCRFEFLRALTADGAGRFGQFCQALDASAIDPVEAAAGAKQAFALARESFAAFARREEA